MKKKLLFPLVVLALSAGAAQAGGWATVQLSSTPAGLGAGEAWDVDVTVLRHGRTPLAGVKPTLTIRNDGGDSRAFRAKPTGTTGVYHARVVFPEPGTWRYEVNDGFVTYGGAQTHGFPAVEIGPAPPGSFPAWPVVGGLLGAAFLAGLALVARWRRSPPTPEPA